MFGFIFNLLSKCLCIYFQEKMIEIATTASFLLICVCGIAATFNGSFTGMLAAFGFV
jgi:hypothetical protein